MALVFACIAPHGGNLLLGKHERTPIPRSRAAMEQLHQEMAASRPDSLAIVTPHGIVIDGAMSLLSGHHAAGDLDDFRLTAQIDGDLTDSWACHASARGIPIAPLISREPGAPLPLDWGVTIPVALLAPAPATPPMAVACPSRDLTRPQLAAWGEALVDAANELDKRVALIVSADQGHGHAATGPYGFASQSAEYDHAMNAAICGNDLLSLLDWDEEWIEAALADSYWQTLMLIGIRRRMRLDARFLSYEVDHYFGLMCAGFTLGK